MVRHFFRPQMTAEANCRGEISGTVSNGAERILAENNSTFSAERHRQNVPASISYANETVLSLAPNARCTMTLAELATQLITRWDRSGRVSMPGRAVVISARELDMIVTALNGASALRSLNELRPCRFCGKQPGTKVGPPPLARCVADGCEGKNLAAVTIDKWNAGSTSRSSQQGKTP